MRAPRAIRHRGRAAGRHFRVGQRFACTIMLKSPMRRLGRFPALHRAALTAIRLQLTSGIARAADRVLAQKTEERVLPGNSGVELERAEGGTVHIWPAPDVATKLKAMRSPGQN